MCGLNDRDLPDAPDIQRAERFGLKPGELPFEPEEEVNCPVCGAACETVYRTADGEIAGCNVCLEPVDALDWTNE